MNRFTILNFKFKNSSKGVTLFIAVSIMAVLLFVSVAIANIAVKSSLFASSGRDSQFAFYAADAGMECAVYWDTRFDPSYFDVSTTSPSTSISCGGQTLTTGAAIVGTSTLTRIGGEGVNNTLSTFGFILNQGSNSVPHCAIVTVLKTGATTYIKSRGYNSCVVGNPRRVERGIEVTY